MMHFPNSNVQPCPVDGPELLHWLCKGRKAFRHRDHIWLRITRPDGSRSLLHVNEGALDYAPHAINQCGVVITARPEFQYGGVV